MEISKEEMTAAFKAWYIMQRETPDKLIDAKEQQETPIDELAERAAEIFIGFIEMARAK